MKPEPSCRIYLIRHGETANAGKVRFNGHHDVELSAKGQQQLRLVSDALKHCSIDAVYSSDLKRTMESARIIAEPHDLKLTTFPELRELSFGEWEGLSVDEVEQKYPGQYLKLFENIDIECPPGGESFLQLQNRVVPKFREIVQSHPSQSIVIVAHGGVNRTLLSHLLEMPIKKMFRLNQEYAAVNIIQYYGDEPVLELIGADHHLMQREAAPEKVVKFQ
ncbi:MAG: alpha-ribazole phosphatase [Nitrospinae bacterium CG11_big_fil_rev_8_21_14_0_20_45_15]|nr:MAG: alpha-ribazole phosphatase [Nitrospinae bacterium CG11_big_fil_rev_8_21_14_0_20_45_15]